jgi:multisubunit Na+/H+ antiporter MnhF subunit
VIVEQKVVMTMMRSPESIATAYATDRYIMQVIAVDAMTAILTAVIALLAIVPSLPNRYKSVPCLYGIMSFVAPRIYTLRDATIPIGWLVIPFIKVL